MSWLGSYLLRVTLFIFLFYFVLSSSLFSLVKFLGSEIKKEPAVPVQYDSYFVAKIVFVSAMRTWYAEIHCQFCQMEAYKRRKQLKQEPLNSAMTVCSDVMFQFNILHSELPTVSSSGSSAQNPHLESIPAIVPPTFDTPSPYDFFSILWVITDCLCVVEYLMWLLVWNAFIVHLW